MKKLFYALTAATVVGTSVVPVAAFVNFNIKDSLKEQELSFYAPTNFNNIIKTINSKLYSNDMNILEKDKNVKEIINEYANKFYQKFLNEKEGRLDSLEIIPKNKVVLQTFSNTYTNRTSNEQTYYSQEYSKEISNTHSFSFNFSEKISIKTSFKVPFIGGTEVNIEVNAGQAWSHDETVVEKIVNPSQPFKVKPYFIGTAKYVISQGISVSRGKLRYAVDKWNDWNEKIDIPKFETNKDGSFKNYSIDEVSFPALVLIGYAESLDWVEMNFVGDSTFSVDEITNKLYVNLPISWESQNGSIDVFFDEQPL